MASPARRVEPPAAPPRRGEALADVAAERARLAFARLDELALPLPRVRFPARERGRRPEARENPDNAWAWRARVRGSGEGALAGWRVAVKDNTAVAGVPMSIGSRALEGFVSSIDATMVDRLLAAGADVLGKAACEDMCFSGGSHTSATGPVRNPHDPTRMAGGSSSGSAVLVARGEVDLATGTDQGGSIAIPSAWCGVVGIKPTFGLVPYTGMVPVEWSIDHAGLLARGVEDVARALDVVAGPDGLDPRQRGAPTPEPYADAPRGDASRMRVALLRDGFGWPGESDARVDALVEARVREALGDARVGEASVALHRDAPCIMAGISNEGAYLTTFGRAPTGPPGPALHIPGLAEAWAEGVARHGDALAPTVKAMMEWGRLSVERWHGRYYARAQSLRLELAAQYARALRDVDALAMPAVPFLPRPLPSPDASDAEVLEVAYQSHNACALDLTGHPTLTLPVGRVDGLPVGLMLVARHGRERALLALGAAVERALGKPTS